MKKLIVGNWKMLPSTLGEAQEILESISNYLETSSGGTPFSLVVCPPHIFTEEISKTLTTTDLGLKVLLGTQDIAIEDEGALTGEISGPMLRKFNVRYSIVGHSERRNKLNESDEVINKKIKSSLRNEMTPIVCVGENSREGDYKAFVQNQIEKAFEGLDQNEIEKCIIAYEPVWAISTNPGAKADNPIQASETIIFIKSLISEKYNIEFDTPVLYGGSVKPENADGFLKHDEINGFLVGGASVRKEEFIKILSLVK